MMRSLLVACAVTIVAMASACSSDAEDDDGSKKGSRLGADGRPVETTPPPAEGCPPVAAPLASACAGGHFEETKDARGCVTGFECIVCPPIAAPPASYCPNGELLEKKNDDGCLTGWDCVPLACPPVQAPLAADCAGTWVERKNDAGCVSGWDCVK